MTTRSPPSPACHTALLAAIVIMLVPAAPLHAAGIPKRIVSLNLCTDELVLRLADRSNIASGVDVVCGVSEGLPFYLPQAIPPPTWRMP
jgi:hypothetical protein